MTPVAAYRISTGVIITPFNDPVGEVPVLFGTLKQYQDKVVADSLKAAVFNVPPDGPSANIDDTAVIFSEEAFFSPHFIEKAWKTFSKQEHYCVQLCLEESDFTSEKSGLGGLQEAVQSEEKVIFKLPIWISRTGFVGPAEREAAIPLLVDQRLFSFVPEAFEALTQDEPDLKIVATVDGALSIRHWVHIIDANHLALASEWFRADVGHIMKLIGGSLWGCLRSLSVSKWSILRGVSKIGRKCDIHPTAVIEGSILGDNVTVAKGASIMGSVIGDGARIEPNAEIVGSFIGKRSVVCFSARAMSMVTYPQAVISQPGAQVGVFGARSTHTVGCYPIDTRLSLNGLQDVPVFRGGERLTSGRKFMGIALGHRSILGTGTWINAASEIPNDVMIVRRKQDVLKKIDKAAAKGIYIIDESEMKPY